MLELITQNRVLKSIAEGILFTSQKEYVTGLILKVDRYQRRILKFELSPPKMSVSQEMAGETGKQ